MRVSEVMTTEPATCTLSCTVQKAAELMKQFNIGFFPVLDKFTRKVVGVVTDRDLCLRVIGEDKHASQTLVSECMTRRLVSCEPEDDIWEALDLMRDEHVRRLVVTDAKGDLQGVFSMSDLIRYASIDGEAICDAIGMICEPGTMSGIQRARVLRKAFWADRSPSRN